MILRIYNAYEFRLCYLVSRVLSILLRSGTFKWVWLMRLFNSAFCYRVQRLKKKHYVLSAIHDVVNMLLIL